MRLVPIAEASIESVAALLAEMHRDSPHGGAVHALSDPGAAMKAATAAVGSGPGVAAFDGSTLVGYLIGPLPRVPGSMTSRLGAAHHAARPDGIRTIYWEMYAAVASHLIAAGCTYHSLPVLAGQRAAVDALVELGFGVDQIDGILPVAQEGVAQSAGLVRVATASDLDRVVELALELVKFHAGPPMFQPALVDLAAIRHGAEVALTDDRSCVVVAEDAGEVVAMAQAGPSSAYPDAADIGMNIVTASARSGGVGTAMVNFVRSWAATRDYHYCTVGWSSGNLLSDAFYRSRGFAPVRFRLHRRIDPRVAWANEALDYSAFPGAAGRP